MRFTSATVAALAMPAAKSDHIEWDPDLPGFGIRIRPSGSKTWIIQGRSKGQGYRESLGDVRKITLDEARSIARKRFAQIELGIDPRAEEKARAAAAAARRDTLGVVADAYLAERAVGKKAMRPSTLKAARHYFAVQWGPLRSKPIAEITKQDVAHRLREIIGEHGQTSAARARSNLSALFAWAMKEYPIEVNPVINTHKPEVGDPRDRVLDDAELRAIWRACRDDDFGRIVRLLMFTACRRDEIGGLRWSEVSLDEGSITIPGERTKNRKEHRLILPPPAADILRTAPRREDREFVFGGRGGAFSAWSYSTLHLAARITEREGTALAPWRLHDIRRTVRTGLSKLGVAPYVAEAVLNHVKEKTRVERTYDHHDYADEKREALARWADHLLSMVHPVDKPSNITVLRTA